MDNYGNISSIDTIPLRQGQHVRDFDEKQRFLKKAARAAARSEAKETESVVNALAKSHSTEENLHVALSCESSEAASHEALEINASVPERSVTTASALDAEYIEDAAPEAWPVQVEPLSVEALVANNSLHDLDLMSRAEMSVLETLSNEGKERIKLRLMRVWDAIALRFESGETMTLEGKTIAGTGGKGMGAYLRHIGINPAKRRSWTFELKQKRMLMLAQETYTPAKKRKDQETPEVGLESQTEAMQLAKAGIRLARTITGDTMMSSAERSERAAKLSVELLEAAHSGNSGNLEESDDISTAPNVTRYEDWQNHRVDVPTFKLKYFQAAAENFKHGSSQALRGAAFMKILELLKNNSTQVVRYAEDFEKLAGVIENVALSLELLKQVIRAALSAPTDSNLTTGNQKYSGRALQLCQLREQQLIHLTDFNQSREEV
jgi:hypothetical protein